MGYYCVHSWDERFEIHIDPGPNYKNDLKLCLMEMEKEYGNTHIFTVVREKYWKWGVGYCFKEVVIGTPISAHLANLQVEQESQLFEPYRRSPGVRRPKRRRNRPGYGKPDLSEEDLLEEALSKPRCRYQRGWKDCYCPTAKTYRRHDDHRSWKTSSKAGKSWNK